MLYKIISVSTIHTSILSLSLSPHIGRLTVETREEIVALHNELRASVKAKDMQKVVSAFTYWSLEGAVTMIL